MTLPIPRARIPQRNEVALVTLVWIHARHIGQSPGPLVWGFVIVQKASAGLILI